MLQQNLFFQLFGLSRPMISITLKKFILGTHNCIIRAFWERKRLKKCLEDADIWEWRTITETQCILSIPENLHSWWFCWKTWENLSGSDNQHPHDTECQQEVSKSLLWGKALCLEDHSWFNFERGSQNYSPFHYIVLSNCLLFIL